VVQQMRFSVKCTIIERDRLKYVRLHNAENVMHTVGRPMQKNANRRIISAYAEICDILNAKICGRKMSDI